MPKYAIKLKICSNGSNAIICLYNFCMDTPFIENPSDFDVSFDSGHKEKICFSIKIRALLMYLYNKQWFVYVYNGQ